MSVTIVGDEIVSVGGQPFSLVVTGEFEESYSCPVEELGEACLVCGPILV